jgi:ribonuclease-3
MRSRIVSRQQFGKLATKFGLDKMIEAESGVKGRSSSISGDVFEALIGAIYLDKGYPFTAAFIQDTIIRYHLDIDEIESVDSDYKSKLIEWAQKNKKELRFKLVEEKISANQKLFVVEATIDGEALGRSESFSKKKAEQESAAIAIVSLGIS